MKRVGDDLPVFLEIIGIRDEKNYGGFVSAWKELIGEELSWHSRPSDIRGSVLIVAVDHPGWMTRIRFAESSLITRLHQRFPQLGITSLAFSLVKELPSSGRIAQTESEVSKEMGTSGGNPVDNSEYSDPSADLPTASKNKAPDELFAALAKLKEAIKRKKADPSE